MKLADYLNQYNIPKIEYFRRFGAEIQKFLGFSGILTWKNNNPLKRQRGIIFANMFAIIWRTFDESQMVIGPLIF